MALDAEDRKLLVVSQLGQTGVAAFEDQVETLWELHEDKQASAGGGLLLRFLYTKLDAIDFLLGEHLDDHDVTEGGVSESYGQVPRNIQALRETCCGQIKSVEARARAGRTPAGGQITAEQVYTSDGTQADPNSRLYRGDPLIRARVPR